jgi:hypothetical protein
VEGARIVTETVWEELVRRVYAIQHRIDGDAPEWDRSKWLQAPEPHHTDDTLTFAAWREAIDEYGQERWLDGNYEGSNE